MIFACTVRLAFTSSLVMMALAIGVPMSTAQVGQHGGNARSVAPQGHFPGMRPGKSNEHLPQWMDRHRDMPLAQQQKALESEPGFRDLPAETQQRLRDRLTQLNNMPPEQRRRLLDRNEAIANLTVPQRQQLRGAMQQYVSLPPDRRRLVARAWRDLREMPEPQRQSILSSDRFRGQFTDEERGTISNLLSVEPYIPVHKPGDPSELGR
jgi:hypothetical protein